MKIAIGNDHAGTEYKLAIVGLLKSMDIEVSNYGTDGSDSVDVVPSKDGVNSASSNPTSSLYCFTPFL